MRPPIKPLLALLVAVGAAAPLAAAEDPVAALGELVPPHHALRGFPGSPTFYAYRPPPAVGYARPDFEGWANELIPTAFDPDAGRFTAVWRDGGGAIRYVLSRGDQRTRIFSIDGDEIEFEDPGFQTQTGVARWGWVYEGGRLRTHRTWRLALAPADESGRPTGPPAPTALFAVVVYEYAGGKSVPSRSRTYWSEEDRRARRWGQKTTYRPDGTIGRVKQNPDRPYPY